MRCTVHGPPSHRRAASLLALYAPPPRMRTRPRQAPRPLGEAHHLNVKQERRQARPRPRRALQLRRVPRAHEPAQEGHRPRRPPRRREDHDRDKVATPRARTGTTRDARHRRRRHQGRPRERRPVTRVASIVGDDRARRRRQPDREPRSAAPRRRRPRRLRRRADPGTAPTSVGGRATAPADADDPDTRRRADDSAPTPPPRRTTPPRATTSRTTPFDRQFDEDFAAGDDCASTPLSGARWCTRRRSTAPAPARSLVAVKLVRSLADRDHPLDRGAGPLRDRRRHLAPPARRRAARRAASAA